MPLREPFRQSIADRLRRLYGEPSESLLPRLDALAERYVRPAAEVPAVWDQRAAILISYGDQLQSPDRPSLQVLDQFLAEQGLDQLFSGLHVLPFFPYSSDDGFSVIDYRRVNPELGGWEHLQKLAESFDLMVDFVVNHCSQQHVWFQNYLRGAAPGEEYFIEVEPTVDLSAVTRPRSSPLLTRFETSRGPRHVWTTFSADQVDLNFASTELLLEMLETLLEYCSLGAKIIRLDAIGFLWKRIGTSCMHLPETHEIVKLMRDLLDAVFPGTLLITETNVPHAENVSYFGQGDEAHAVYQFSLAPLLLDAFTTGDAGPLTGWLSGLEAPGPGRTFFNFTASHDGIGVRPLEGLVPQERFDALVEGVRRRGGLVSMRRGADGRESPYELNTTYFSALDSVQGLPQPAHVRRFLTSQAVMLALQGIPGVYFHSLVGTPNFLEGVRLSGHNRTINRQKFELEKMRQVLSDKGSAQSMVFDGYRHLLRVRIAQPAFHPDARQTVLDLGTPGAVGFLREDSASGQRIAVLASVSDQPLELDLNCCGEPRPQRDLISGRPVRGDRLQLAPGESVWLS